MTILESESTLTERYQTTIPAAVRKALRLQKHDKIVFKVTPDGKVALERAGGEEDPALGRFLGLLARDIAAGTAHPVSPALLQRIKTPVGDAQDYLEAPLRPVDAEHGSGTCGEGGV